MIPFAWFSVTNAVTFSNTTAANNGIGVAATNVSADSAVIANLLKVDVATTQKTSVTGLAHHNASATGSGASVHLSTAYIDANGKYHGIDGDGGKVLFDTLVLTISIDEEATGWNGDKSIYSEGGFNYTKADIVAQLNANTLTVKALESASSRLRLFNGSAALNDPYSDYVDSARTGTKQTIGTAVLSGFTAENLFTKTVNVQGDWKFYVYGGPASDAAAEVSTVSGTVDVDITGARTAG